MLLVEAILLFKFPIPISEIADDVEVDLLPLAQLIDEVAVLWLWLAPLPEVFLTEGAHVVLKGMHTHRIGKYI